MQTAGGIFTGKFGFGVSDEATINLGNTILSGNFVGSSLAYQGWATDGQLHSLGYNQCSDRFTPLSPTNNNMRVTNFFGRPITNGATVLYPLNLGTPAIDKGDPVNSPAVDQRGLPRPFGAGFDVGAQEQTLRFTTITRYGFGTPTTNVQVTFSPYLRSTNYILESTTFLWASNWTVVRSNISFNINAPWADITTVHPAGGNDRQRFYRVRVQP